jgi:hypothetical protein
MDVGEQSVHLGEVDTPVAVFIILPVAGSWGGRGHVLR